MSLACLAILAGGYFGQVGVTMRSRVAGAPASAGQTVVLLLAEEGRIKYWREDRASSGIGGSPAGLHVTPVVRLFPFRGPDLRRSVWEFDAHHLNIPGATSALIIACPIWCVALPFMIAPAIWMWRRRKRRRVVEGFAVVTEPARPRNNLFRMLIRRPSASF